ncbi:MAG TPA: polysaccharide biosynthesis tyrosine autokinase [bacterium]|nr:polysaccharide biosynthesis tyrosine autokinase [bacterium]
MEIRDYWAIIWKRKFIVFLCVIGVALIGFLYTFIYLEPVYSATARILVDQPSRVLLITSPTPNMQAPMSVETQRKLLKSRAVAERAAEKLNWPPEKAIELVNRVMDKSDEDTGIIYVTIEGGNPAECSSVANAYARAFEDFSKDLSEKSYRETLEFIKQQLDHARESLEEKEKNIYEFNLQNGVVMLDETAIQKNKNIADFETERIRADIEVRLLETQSAGVRAALRDKTLLVAQNVESLAETTQFTSGNADSVTSMLMNLKMEKEWKLRKYKPEHPAIKDIDDRIAVMEKQMEKHASDVINNRAISPAKYVQEQEALEELNTQIQLARVRSANLESNINRLKAEQLDYPLLQYELSRLVREKQIAEELFMMLYEQHQRIMIEEVRKDVKVRVFDEAETPNRPIRPNRAKNMAVALVFGLLSGIGLAFILEEMEETVRTSDDVKTYLNLPVLGSIPYSAETINKLITDVPLKSPIAEAYRRLSFFTQLFCLDPPVKTLLVTSSKSDEGKSTTMANLAISMAQEGTKVLMIDTDLRRPMLHRMFGVDNSLGLSSILTGELEAEIAVSDLSVSGRLPKESFMDVVVDRLIQPVGIKGLSMIPSGPLPANSIELLRSERMLQFLRCVERKADIVMFDSPPSIHVIDSVVMAQMLDGVLLVINSGRINRDEAVQVKYMIESTKTPIIGVALNNIEASSPDYYYYYYYGGYGYGSRQRQKRVKLKR